MGADKNPQKVDNDVVVSLAYKLTVDGEVLDQAGDADAIQYLQGHSNIISGLEKQLAGLKVGDSKKVVVSAEEGYGPIDEDAFDDVALDEFPEGIEPEVGMELEMRDEDGNEMYGRVTEVQKESAKMDFNHPLAGKELHFEIKVVGLREPTGEELTHGHAHAPGHHH